MGTIRESMQEYIPNGECTVHWGFFHSTEDPNVVAGGSYLNMIHRSMLCEWATVDNGSELCINSSPLC